MLDLSTRDLMLLLVLGVSLGLCLSAVLFAYSCMRSRREKESTCDRDLPVQQPSEPVEQVTRDFAWCCICKQMVTAGAGSAHPLDPCGLVLVAHYDKSRKDQKEMLSFCHFECFRKVAGDVCLALTLPGSWTVGMAGHGVLADLPPELRRS